MRLPSLRDCVCSVTTVAQKGAPLIGAASMPSTRIVTMPGLDCIGPPLNINVESGDICAVAPVARVKIEARARMLLFKRMLCFLPKSKLRTSKLSAFNPDSASDAVGTDQHIRVYRHAGTPESRVGPGNHR